MSILIKNGMIYDGSGDTPFESDILVRGNFIAGLGNYAKSKADIVIDAEGSMVTPGFIDINSASDRFLYLLSDPGQNKFIDMGVTTAVIGTCGSSLAPIFSGYPDVIDKWGAKFSKSINVDWQTFEEFYRAIEKRGVGINLVSLVGHSTIRRSLVRGEYRDLTEKEIDFFQEVLKDAFDLGVAGISFGLEFADSRNVSYEEIKKISEIAAKHKKLVSIHLRNPDDIRESFNEIFRLAEDTGANIEISHLQPPKNHSMLKEYRVVRESIEDQGKKSSISFDCYPENKKIIPIYKFLPEWAREGNLDSMNELLRSGKRKEDVLEHLKNIVKKDVVIAHAPPSLNFFEGKSVKEFSKDTGMSQASALLKIMDLSSLRAVCLYDDVDDGELMSFLGSKASFVGSNGMHIVMPEANPFMSFINKISKYKTLPLEKAIAKTTAGVADKLRIKKRGRLKEGCYADLIVINKGEVRDVVINGQVAKENYKLKEELSGEILKIK